MTPVMVFIRRNGLLVAAPVTADPDGCHWNCPHCQDILMRASFGVLSGLTRCSCGADAELCVGGRWIDIEAVQATQEAGPPIRAEVPTVRAGNDQDFLRECGIALSDEESTPC